MLLLNRSKTLIHSFIHSLHLFSGGILCVGHCLGHVRETQQMGQSKDPLHIGLRSWGERLPNSGLCRILGVWSTSLAFLFWLGAGTKNKHKQPDNYRWTVIIAVSQLVSRNHESCPSSKLNVTFATSKPVGSFERLLLSDV